MSSCLVVPVVDCLFGSLHSRIFFFFFHLHTCIQYPSLFTSIFLSMWLSFRLCCFVALFHVSLFTSLFPFYIHVTFVSVIKRINFPLSFLCVYLSFILALSPSFLLTIFLLFYLSLFIPSLSVPNLFSVPNLCSVPNLLLYFSLSLYLSFKSYIFLSSLSFLVVFLSISLSFHFFFIPFDVFSLSFFSSFFLFVSPLSHVPLFSLYPGV